MRKPTLMHSVSSVWSLCSGQLLCSILVGSGQCGLAGTDQPDECCPHLRFLLFERLLAAGKHGFYACAFFSVLCLKLSDD